MNKTVKIMLIALIVAMLFLVVGVDYMPKLFAYAPMIVWCWLAAHCKPLVRWWCELDLWN